jgi:hypothetical protein
MKNLLLFCLVIILMTISNVCFPWGENEHPISELLIERLYLDTNYVYCGSDALWGTNAYGLFVFNRKTETWTNYPSLFESNLDLRVRDVKVIEREGDFIYATYRTGIALKFNRTDGAVEEVNGRRWEFQPQFSIISNNMNYRISQNTVVVESTKDTSMYSPSSEQITKPTGVEPIPENLTPIFSHPVLYHNNIYMPYDLDLGVPSSWTNGIAVFDVIKKTFSFYGSDIFKGSVTGSFIFDSLLIFSTASREYEFNARPAAGFVAFNPRDFRFSLWQGLPLLDTNFAIFQVEQDEGEFWIGTDKGVLRIDKATKKTWHYQITKGIAQKDSLKIYSSCGNFESNSSMVVAQVNKGDSVDLLGEMYEWCEIKSSKIISGWVEAKYVEKVIAKDIAHKNILKFKPLNEFEVIPVKAGPYLEIPILMTINANSLLEHEYELIDNIGSNNQISWYKIRLPSAWINMDNLNFLLGEIK